MCRDKLDYLDLWRGRYWIEPERLWRVGRRVMKRLYENYWPLSNFYKSVFLGPLKSTPPSPVSGIDVRSLVDINLLALLHQSLLVENNDLRTMVLDTMYVLMTRSVVPVTDSPLIAMRREAFSEHSLQGYQQVLDQIFSAMITSSNGHLDVNRETYGVGKKFVMVLPPPHQVKLMLLVHLRISLRRTPPPPL